MSDVRYGRSRPRWYVGYGVPLIIAGLFAGTPAVARGQAQQAVASSTPDSTVPGVVRSGVMSWGDRPQDAALPLPLPRELDATPPVDVVGQFAKRDGNVAFTPMVRFAVSDLRTYDYQLSTLFPNSATAYPDDSIRALKQRRAAAWLRRLRPATGFGTATPYRVDLLEVASRAGDDSLARLLLDAELASIPSGHAGDRARSIALAAGVAAFTDLTQEIPRLSRNLVVAERYAMRLAAIPTTGYTLRSDSTDILYRQVESTLALALAADRVQAATSVLVYANRLLDEMTALGLSERRLMTSWVYPYREVATVLMAQPKGRAQLDSLDTKLLALVVARPAEVDVSMDTAQRAADLHAAQQFLRERFASIALLGRPAPPLRAHVVFNSADSVYRDSARTYTFADGIPHVLAFGGLGSAMLPALDRLHARFAGRARVTFVTETQGFVGPDVVSPTAEVAWLSTYYTKKRHLALPILVWAGPRVAGEYGSSSPMPSPSLPAYHPDALPATCVLVDANGIVRGYQPLKTRDDEAQLARQLQALVDETAGQPTSRRVPHPAPQLPVPTDVSSTHS